MSISFLLLRAGCLILGAIFITATTDTLTAAGDESLIAAIAKIKQVQPDGVGQDEAVAAIQTLNSASIDQLPQILIGMDGANRLALNWLRGAVNSIVARGGPLPRADIEAFFADSSHSHMGRLLAFDLLALDNPGWEAQMIPKLIDDSSLPLRAKAITAAIDRASAAADQEAIGELGFALSKSRDVDQILKIAKLLEERGISIDLQSQLGSIGEWHVIGPFDNKNEAGFNTAQGPEQSLDKIDLKSTFTDVNGDNAAWRKTATRESTGTVELNDIFGPLRGATVYAHAAFDAAEAQDAEIRIGCINAHKVWVNGQLVVSNEVYHNGMSPDQFRGSAKLNKGDNQILVKICQNEQTEPWANLWQFQLRVCDPTGLAIRPVAKPQQDY